jgi:hypothetical protein
MTAALATRLPQATGAPNRGELDAAAFDEMTGSDGAVRPAYRALAQWLAEVPPDVLDNRRREAELLFRRIGITFAVYGMAEAQGRLIPVRRHSQRFAGGPHRDTAPTLSRAVDLTFTNG